MNKIIQMMDPNRIPNAKKWTQERVTKELAEIKKLARCADIVYLGSALDRQDLYIQLWAYWKKIFVGDDDILEQMLIIENIFESKLVAGAYNKKVSPQIALFILRCKHKWNDKIVVERSASKAEREDNGEQLLRSMGLWEAWQAEKK